MDRIKIRFSRPKFIHVSEKKMTICIMNFSVPELDINSRIKGTSKCNDSDDYNKKTGERIAQSRAEIAARNKVKEVAIETLRKVKLIEYELDNLICDIKNFNNHDKESILEFVVED